MRASFLFVLVSFLQKCSEFHFYLCSYQPWTGGHRLPFLVPGTTASLRNPGPLCTIVLSCRKCSPLLTPSIHWVSCVRLPRPVFIFFAFCLRPPYRIFLTSTEKHSNERMALSLLQGRGLIQEFKCIFTSTEILVFLAVPHPAEWPAFLFPKSLSG